MKKLREILFLKAVGGVGNARISKFYLQYLRKNDGIDVLKDLVLANETKVDKDSVNEAIESSGTIYNAILDRNDLQVYTILDAEYPNKLNALGNKRPCIIYVKGDVSAIDERNIAVVGTRDPVEHAANKEVSFVKATIECSERVIVSGLAAGCDTIAHKACIDAGGKTVAVLPCGFDHIVPEENKAFCDNILATGGVLISEYPPDTKATQYTFVERDAIIAALGDATLVMQCGMKSGTMHTVNAAAKMHRKIGVYNPGDNAIGDFSGNRYIIDSKDGISISDTEELGKFLESLRESEGTDEPVQMTIFDIMGD
ncbi:DNA processing protein [Butyrivibrio sp. ob235]|uniref:DNA-processing protein DprA n=1 Tax=Butyrivibrio sp. ob235 TaxID=1761780 RepID=UPI0008CBABE8|nr:DNA-processing protein DprA [Butyrivibrio sp. ob235]SEL76378.1 DNA processing protein [Butyrivibrio sp. ob235]